MQPLSAVLGGVCAALRSASWSAERVAHWIRLDPALSAWLLATRTRAFGARSEFTSLNAGVAQIGRPLLFALLHGLVPAGGSREGVQQLRQALATAAIARRLALATGYARPEEAYLAALLADYPTEAGSAVLGPLAADAARYCRRPLRELASAHPLLGIVGAAVWAMDRIESWPAAEEVAEAAALVGLRTAGFTGEVTRGRHWARRVVARLKSWAPSPSPAEGMPGSLAIAGRLHPLQELWFHMDSAPELQADILRCVRALRACSALLMAPDADGPKLRVCPDDKLPAMAGELAVDRDLAGSALAAAFRGGRGPFVLGPEQAESLPVADRQVLGLLSADRALCVPLAAAGDAPAALLILGGTEASLPAADDEFLLRFAELAGTTLSLCRLRKRRLQRLLDEQKDAWADQARQVGHEIGNSLAIVRNYLTILGEQQGVGVDLAAGLKVIGEEADRMTGMLDELRRPSAGPRREPVDINRLVRETVSRTGAALLAPRQIASALDLDPRLPSAVTDAPVLRQALVNLLRNAAEAMPEAGRLVVATAAVNQGGRLFAEISVRDSGPGIGAERLAEVFHPVATGKGPGHEGLGLSIVRAGIARLGGEVAFRNFRDGGAEFSLLIPLSPPAAAGSAGGYRDG